MIQTGFESRVKVQDLIDTQLPSFILEESPNAVEFLKQYYISQEYQGGPIDISDNLDQYLKLDNLIPEVVVDSTTLESSISESNTTLTVSSTKGFPDQYGLLKINDEIITYTGKTTNSFTGCLRGFSGITNYRQDLNQEELIFSTSTAAEHSSGTSVENLSALFLKDFYKKLKSTFAPGFEDISLVEGLDAGNFIRRVKDFYESKGTDESIKILFNVIFGEKASVINLEDYLLKSSSANYVRRKIVLVENISDGDILKLSGQTLYKTSDIETNAPISSVESFSIKGRNFYKLELFIGNDERSLIQGDFVISPNTRVLENVSVGSSVISVDSTVSFPKSGTLISGSNTITYTNKSVNQFFGCSGVNQTIGLSDLIRSDETYFSYENGDTNKKVEFIILGSISDLIEKNISVGSREGDIVTIEGFGDKIENNKNSYKEIFANSWIYNTNTSYEIIDNDSIILGSPIDRSSLKVGDVVEITDRVGENIVSSGEVYITVINDGNNSIILNGTTGIGTGIYSIRRKLNKAYSSGPSFEYGNESVISDVLNLYSDNEDYAYIASNSLPSSELVGIATEYRIDVDENIKTVGVSSFIEKDPIKEVYNTFNLDSAPVPFYTGDRVVYTTEDEPIPELEIGESYYIKVVGNQTFKLYFSPAFIESDNNIQFTLPEGTHTFTLYSQRDLVLGSQKLLRKIPLQKNIEKGDGTETSPGPTGMLINGVEINNYKSNDSIYYGPISDVDIFSAGNDYDVINLPSIEFDTGSAKIQPVVSGGFKKVFVDSQDYDIDKIISINIKGGNGSGAVIEPVLSKQQRSILFNSEEYSNGGGINTTTNQILFDSEHNLINGEEIIYDPLGSDVVPSLPSGSSYFVQVDNNSTVTLYTSLIDQQLKLNPVTFDSGSTGTHQFQTAKRKNKVSYIKVLEEGSGYTNRILTVKSSGISTTQNTINFKNHGFNDGDLITYDYETSPITGILTTNQYYVLKVNDDSFRLSDAGIEGVDTSNFDRRNYSKITSTGSGYQYFSYPDISVSIRYNPVGFGSTTQTYQDLSLTPVVKGSIIDAYVYEGGTGYGSTILNYEKKPTLSVKTGKNAIVSPVIINGTIKNVYVDYPGVEYHSIPELIVTDSTGSGTGAELRAIISDNKISSVKIVNPGIGYSESSTSIKVVSSGNGAFVESKVRKLTVNDSSLDGRFPSGKVLLVGNDKLQYSVSKYFSELRDSFLESSKDISKIIGWAYDGNPIYGPYGTIDPNNIGSDIKELSSGYTIDISKVTDRPSGFNPGYFVDDYVYTNNGDLDEHNGRYEINKDFPNGIYAYHATVNSFGDPTFPYFMGNTYNSKLVLENIDQSYDLNNSGLLRNTQPYKILEENANYQFLDETSILQKIEVDSISEGSIEKIEILNSGDEYKVGDKLSFDEDGTFGNGLSAIISSLKGKEVSQVNSTSSSYLNSIFTWKSEDEVEVSILPNHTLSSSDYVNISGFSTNLSKINGFYKIQVPSYNDGRCLSTITSSTAGFTTEIYVSPIPEQISIGSSITIGTETLKILDIFRNENIIRIERGSTGVSHTVGTAVSFLPDSFTISENIDKFESKVNNKVYFNPRESVGVGTTSGVGYSTSFTFGNITVVKDIPTRSISIEDHPFTNNQQIVYTSNGSDIVSSTDGVNTFNLSSVSTLYAINKQPNLIGLKTAINGSELYFHNNGDDDDQYLFESNYTQVLGSVENNEITVSVSTSHGLQVGDTIKLNVEPNLSVGIGTSTAVRVLYKSEIDAIVINPIGFNSTGVSTTTNEIIITNHGLVTGDKVFYEDPSNSNVDKKSYYVLKINDNTFNLCETYFDTQNDSPNIVSFASTGGSSQILSLINPEINPVKNNNLVFDLTDSSLSGYELKIFCENTFENEFVSTGSTNSLAVSGVGTAGVSANASLTLDYNSDIPKKLYYILEQNGTQIGYDGTVVSHSEIEYKDSAYKNSYIVNEITDTTFTVSSNRKLEKSSYSSSECDTLDYSTLSNTAEGPVNTINIINSGFGYKNIPSLKSVDTENGKDLIINPISNTIGKNKNIKVITDNYTYSSDKTLSPKADLGTLFTVSDTNTFDSISVTNGGNGYTSSPDVIIVNKNTRETINSGILVANVGGQVIESIDIVSNPKGLPDDTVEIFTTNNSNGISILEVESSNSGIFTCTITTPQPSGFSTYPFNIGDKVFIEGIQKIGEDGTGFNSEDYGYRLLTVSDYQTSTNDKVTIDVTSYTTNTGIANTVLGSFGTIINEIDYPTFDPIQKISEFKIGEKISVNNVSTDLTVAESNKNSLRLFGSYVLTIGDTIIGQSSLNIATINQIKDNYAIFKIDYGNTKDIGWSNDTGKLSLDSQVTANNDYYQNLSYSIKSAVTYKDQQSPVENLVHTSGLKNFADTEILKSSPTSPNGINSDITQNIIYDVSDENRVDTVNNFDLATDIDVLNSRSKNIRLKNKRLSDYTLIGSEGTNSINALKIDNIDNLFSNSIAEPTLFTNIEKIDIKSYYNYIIKTKNPNDSDIQLNEITIINNGTDAYIAENQSISNNTTSEQYGSYELYENEFDEYIFRFNPEDPYDSDYDIKIIRQTFDEGASGVGTTSIGFIDITSRENTESTGIGSTTIIEVNSSEFNSLFLTAQVLDNTSNPDIDYVQIYVTHDGSDAYVSEYYVDTNSGQLSRLNGGQIGTFYSELDGGVLSIYHTNNSNTPIKIRSNIVGFGTTSAGIGTFRYILDGQIEGNERTAVYESKYYSTVSAASTTIQTLDSTLFDASKCLVEVSAGSTKALHNIMMIYDGVDVYTHQAPFLSASNVEVLDDASGIGTFGGEISGSDILIKFYPDTNQTGEINIEVFSKSLYKDLDISNEPDPLTYGIIEETVENRFYNSINGERINRTNFSLLNNNTPIFSKSFNPSIAVSPSTGIFTIEKHFFSDQEELIYTPKSTFIGVSSSPLVTPSGDLPSTVYAIKLSEDTFKVATTKSDAQAGIGTTFTSLGSGNAHQFTMSDTNTKTIITIDNLVQYPISSTKITHTLSGNVGGGITESTEIISLSGISTINPKDILKINDEYMGVLNVGLGTTNVGPITNTGSDNLVQVERGFVGSAASSHTDSDLVRVYKGSYNIVDNEIHFTDPPRGNPQIDKTRFNLDYETSQFTGRVFLKSDYTDNKVYDDISDEFTGIGRTFTLKVGGANTVGLGSTGGSGLVFINSIYQSPKTANNPNNFNYLIEENTVAGVTTLTFSGVRRPDNILEYVTSDYDVNVNEIPRGGIIISYGSTPGLGFAPLVGASVTATVSAGAITAIGIGTTGSFGSGYNGLVSIGVTVFEEGHSGTPAVIEATANVGAGGTLSFNIVNPGTGYTNPQIFVSDPSYDNLPVVGVSRLGIGATTDTGIGLLMDLEVGSSVGIGSTLYEVKNFKFSRPGYAFQRGDVFKPVGLVTDTSLSSPLSEFTITVLDTFSDSFAAWEFGNIDYIDSISTLQDGSKTIFPLKYNGELLSFEVSSNATEILDNLNNFLIIFINGILQDPGVNYTFTGGSFFKFTTAPLKEDDVQIYFYKGSVGDTRLFDNVYQTLEVGDGVQILKNNNYPESSAQDKRTVYNLSFSDKFETNIYSGSGIDEVTEKPLSWTKKKTGTYVNGVYVSKVRDSIETLIFPTARVIKDFTDTDTEIFVDNTQIFTYEADGGYTNDHTTDSVNILLVDGKGGINTITSGSVEFMSDFNLIEGTSGAVTGIGTTSGIGTDLALKFTLENNFVGFETGFPIYIHNTRIGSGVTSIDDSDSSIVGVGTEYLDNIYYASGFDASTGIITCNVKSDSNIIGLSTSGDLSNPVGKFSWGRLSNSGGTIIRSNPISIGVSGNIVSGLSTYPTIQRRGGVNIRSTGALPKIQS